MTEKFNVFVYHHTHWDREWWTTMQDLRIRLVELIDELLDVLDDDPEFRCFLLDGQTIVLKDYLEIRPENEVRLLKYIHENRIQCGPWYILPDEFLVSGEAHIRNLWLGEKMAGKLGYENLKIGYIPDTFGHISQMPQILQGFGIDNSLIWRGTGGDPEHFKQEFMWEAPDGSKVLTYWFPDGYYVVDFLHFDNPEKTYDETYGRVKKSLERWSKRATTDCLLMPYGGDHRLIDKRLPKLINKVNKEFEQYEFHFSSTKEFIDAIKERSPKLETIKGELREFGEELPHVLPGVLSARMYLKQLNFAGQNWLERYAEPFSALAWKLGRKYESTLLWTAWEFLIQNHPHDSICGCSIDQVHREMIPRFDQSKQIAEIITEKSVQYINEQIDTSEINEKEKALVIHNSLTWERIEMANVLAGREEKVHPGTHRLTDAAGNEIPFQVKEAGTTRPMTDKYNFTEIKFIANKIPALGYKTFTLSKREEPLDPKLKFFTAHQASAKLKGSEPLTDLKIGNGNLENSFLKVEVDPLNGTLTITDKMTGKKYDGLNVFEDSGDAGDEYAYAGPLNDFILRTDQKVEKIHVSLAEAGHSSATLRVDIHWMLPKAISEDRLSRQSDYVDTNISTFVTLAAHSKRVNVKTEWNNVTEDHRLRALFPLGEEVNVSKSEGHFDVLERRVVPEEGNGWPEPYVPMMPQQGYVSINGATKGLTIVNKGLPEYEVLQDGNGTIALTTLRAIGWCSREDTLVRMGGAGPETPTPDAQSLGKNSVEYSIIPHEGDYLQAKSYLKAHEFLTPLYGSLTGRHKGNLPREKGLIKMDDNHTLLLSACKKAERSDALILRFWNTAHEKTKAKIQLSEKFTNVCLVNLKEEPIENEAVIVSEDDSFALNAGPAAIVTIKVEF
jgi:alpha-mannosidase